MTVQHTNLSKSADFDLLDEPLADAVRASLDEALSAGVVFDDGETPLEVFRSAMAASIRDIQTHPRGDLLQRFVIQGPYEYEGDIPTDLAGQRLTDDETAAAISFVISWMVYSFQGRVAELLAAAPVLRLVRALQNDGKIPPDATLYVGDAVSAPKSRGVGAAKAADLHVLSRDPRVGDGHSVIVAAIGEVKSYAARQRRIDRQLAGHAARCRRGLIVGNVPYSSDRITLTEPVLIWVEPAAWKLPRTFRFETKEGSEFLQVDDAPLPSQLDLIRRADDGTWRITLRWSHEALASTAYDMTFWFMERVGEAVFSEDGKHLWPELTPSQAGRNAATAALYCAILRARTPHEHARAVALYNMYGFGYALGMNFRDPQGRRKMLWPEDLRAILARGVADDGYRITE